MCECRYICAYLFVYLIISPSLSPSDQVCRKLTDKYTCICASGFIYIIIYIYSYILYSYIYSISIYIFIYYISIYTVFYLYTLQTPPVSSEARSFAKVWVWVCTFALSHGNIGSCTDLAMLAQNGQGWIRISRIHAQMRLSERMWNPRGLIGFNWDSIDMWCGMMWLRHSEPAILGASTLDPHLTYTHA